MGCCASDNYRNMASYQDSVEKGYQQVELDRSRDECTEGPCGKHRYGKIWNLIYDASIVLKVDKNETVEYEYDLESANIQINHSSGTRW